MGRQGFCEEIETRFADALVGQDVSRISARKEDLDIGLERPDLIDYLYAVLPGHDYVNDDEIDTILVCDEGVYSLLTVGRLDDSVSRSHKEAFCEAANLGIILGKEDRPAALPDPGGFWSTAPGLLVDDGQVNVKSGPDTYFGIGGNEAVMLLDYAVRLKGRGPCPSDFWYKKGSKILDGRGGPCLCRWSPNRAYGTFAVWTRQSFRANLPASMKTLLRH